MMMIVYAVVGENDETLITRAERAVAFGELRYFRQHGRRCKLVVERTRDWDDSDERTLVDYDEAAA